LTAIIVGLDACGGAGTKTAPGWVREGRPIQFADIPDADYAYLSDWLVRNAKPAEDYFIGLYKRHDLIIFGEGHNVREHKEFIINLIPRLYKEAGVRCIGWEFSNPTANPVLENLTTAPEYDAEALLDFARSQTAHEWNSKEHWGLIEAVRKLNASLLPGAEKMRFVGIDIVIDWVDTYIKIKTVAKDSPEAKALNELEQKRDVEMAENVEREILARGIKGLVFVGRGHDETHFGTPPDQPYRRPITGKVLYDKYGEKVHQVSPDWGEFPAVTKAMDPARPLPIGFEMAASPFASILIHDMGPDPVKMEKMARGYMYFGPPERLHRNTAIAGFVTEEMFAKYKNYYEIDIGRTFASATELDEWLQENRWPQPGR
jgi:uncharacterized iron-regulated protein